jgi:hypothetical protein
MRNHNKVRYVVSDVDAKLVYQLVPHHSGRGLVECNGSVWRHQWAVGADNDGWSPRPGALGHGTYVNQVAAHCDWITHPRGHVDLHVEREINLSPALGKRLRNGDIRDPAGPHEEARKNVVEPVIVIS